MYMNTISMRQNRFSPGRWATLLLLTAFGCCCVLPVTAENLVELETRELQRAPHKYWSRGILFRDVLEKGAYGRDVTIGEKKYFRVKGRELGAIYIPEEMRPAFELLKLDKPYLFQGTVLNYKGDFVVVGQSVTASMESSAEVMEMIKAVGTPITSASQEIENPAYQNFDLVLKNSQNALFAEAEKMGVSMEDLFRPDAEGNIPAPELVHGAIRRIERDQQTTAFDLLLNLVTAALYDEVQRRKEPPALVEEPVDHLSEPAVVEQEPVVVQEPAVLEPPMDPQPVVPALEPVAVDSPPMETPMVMSAKVDQPAESSEPGFWERRRIRKAERAAEREREKALEEEARLAKEQQKAAEKKAAAEREAAERLIREQQKAEREQIERAEKALKAEQKAAEKAQRDAARAEEKRLKAEQDAAEQAQKEAERAEEKRLQAEQDAREEAEKQARQMAAEQEAITAAEPEVITEPEPAPAPQMQEDQLSALRAARKELKEALDSGNQKDIQAAADQLRQAVAAARASTRPATP